MKKMKIKSLLAIFVAGALVCVLSGSRNMDIVAQKNFPLVCSLYSDEAASICSSDKTLQSMAEVKRLALQNAGTGAESAKILLFTEEEIESASARLSALYSPKNALGRIVRELRDRGSYFIYDSLPDREFLAKAFIQDAAGINNALSVYALGSKGQYAGIDSISFDVHSGDFRDLQANINSNTLKETALSHLFFDIPLKAAMRYMEASERDEAADFEPLSEGENKAAMAAVRTTEWNAYPYTVILVPGLGPDIAGQRLAPSGRLRAEYAAMLYKECKAPFIIVSGGRVHPRQTKFIEAAEMKNYLVEQCGIPESAIFIDPHARHTTTNIRNAARIMQRAGIPMDRKALISSSKGQLNYIASENFNKLCIRMMQVSAFTLGERLNDRELEFIPSVAALQCSPVDPLDP